MGFTLSKGGIVRFVGTELIALDLLAIMTAYLFLYCGEVWACIFALSQGIFIDIFSGGVQGLFALIYTAVYGTIWVGSRLFDLQFAKGQVLIVLFAMVIKTLLFVFIISIVSQKGLFPESYLWVLGALTMGTALITPVVFFVLDRIKSVILKDTGKGRTGHGWLWSSGKGAEY